MIDLVRDSPDDAEILALTSAAVSAEGTVGDRIAFFESTRDFRKPELSAALGEAYAEIRQYDKAIGAFEESLALHPEDGKVRLALARCLHLTGELEESGEHYRKCVELMWGEPPAAEAMIGLAEVSSELRRFDDARELYGEVLKTNPHEERALIGLRVIEARADDPAMDEEAIRVADVADQPWAMEFAAALL
ncbi:MAG: tetratricopeptide repeat protein, partial [Pseudomonadota bacterium]